MNNQKFYESIICRYIRGTPRSDVRHRRRSHVGMADAREEHHSILLASGYTKPQTRPRPNPSHTSDYRPIWTHRGWALDLPRLKGAHPPLTLSESEAIYQPVFQFRAKQRRARLEVIAVHSRIQNMAYEMSENRRSPQSYRASYRTEWAVVLTTQVVSSKSSGHD